MSRKRYRFPYKCHLCGRDVSRFEDDFAVRVVRTIPNKLARSFDDAKSKTELTVHLCEKCSNEAVVRMGEAIGKKLQG